MNPPLSLSVLAVYNCRTPNSWESDLALSATHNRQSGLTFAIVYGSTFAVEHEILKRLQSISIHAAHPLLLPGIIAELELARHTQLVDKGIGQMEARILELDVQPTRAHEFRRSEFDERDQSRITAWLDLTYLRNSLTAWTTQLLKMAEHAESLNLHEYNGAVQKNTTHFRQKRVGHFTNVDDEEDSMKSCSHCAYESSCPLEHSQTVKASESEESLITINKDEDYHRQEMRKVGEKIQKRIMAIREEYNDRIGDCTMRLNGVETATNWVFIPFKLIDL